MKLILAQPRGFFASVVRAIEIAERALAKYGAPIYVRHEIVHNGHVAESLKAKGARFVENLSDVPRGPRTIFSAHGVARLVEEEAAELGLPVGDATCPLVAKVHGQGEHYVAEGRAGVPIGHAGHSEVEGTKSRIPGSVYLVQSAADVDKLALAAGTPVAYVTQTTQSVDDTKSVIAALKQKFPGIVGPETKDICYTTQNRQSAVRQLGQLVDVILVVGAKNSSNSNRLREIGAEAKVPSYLVAGKNDLDFVRGAGTIEITMLPGVEEDIEFRLPSELLDARPAERPSVAAL